MLLPIRFNQVYIKTSGCMHTHTHTHTHTHQNTVGAGGVSQVVRAPA
jgi:hypothetical protein